MSCMLSNCVPRNRCAGLQQSRLSHLWHTSKPVGIVPNVSSHAFRWASAHLPNCPYPSGLATPAQFQQASTTLLCVRGQSQGAVMTDWGRDTLCADSRRTGRMVTGTRLLAQRCYHRLVTPRGALRGGEDEENFGEDLSQLIGQAATDATRLKWISKIRQELTKDEQVDDVAVTIEASTVAGETTWTIVVDVTSAQGPFQLVLSVDSVTTKILRFSQ